MGSFKLRLVLYFVLLSLLPLLAASWAFSEMVARAEAERADARLNAALRVAIAHYTQAVSSADSAALSLAEAAVVRSAFASGNRAPLVELARGIPHSAFYSNARLLAGTPPTGLAARRSATVVTDEGVAVGQIVVWLPLDSALAERLGAGAGLEEGDRLVFASQGGVAAGPARLKGPIDVPVRRPRYVALGKTSFRAVGTTVLAREPGASLVALTPKSAIDSAARQLRRRVLLFALVALAVVALLAYALGRAVVRSLKDLAGAAGAVARGQFSRRVRVRGRDEFASLGRAFNDMAAQLESRLEELAAERRRARDAVARFGEALAATHEPQALLAVIAESTVEATGAGGGRLLVGGREVASAGDPGLGGRPLEIPLGDEDGEEAVLVLAPPEDGFSEEARELAGWLGSQASVALENVRLHRRVQRQATTDELTELSNRRHFQEELAGELSRAKRFGGEVALILADLDDFKQVNDRHGHQAGDDVLRAFADVLRESVRTIDLPARYGGEEFAVLLPQTDVAGAASLADRLREALASRPVVARNAPLLTVTASFGVAAFPEAPTQAALFVAADEALYRAKAQGKNCVVVAGADEAVAAVP